MKNEVLSQLPASFPWRGNIHHFDTIDSTNTEAKKLAAAGAPHGTVILADAQTGGHGRLGRSFHSPAGSGIYMSVILRPSCTAEALMHLTCAVAVATVNGVEAATGLRPQIKWTNDLVVETHKLGGILTELSCTTVGMVDYAVIGIGINCNQKADDFSADIKDLATSVRMCIGTPVAIHAVAASILTALEQICRSLDNSNAIMTQYRKDCMTIGQKISLVRGDEIRHGTALDVEDDGALQVQLENGHVEIVNSGEVSVRGMYGYI